MHLPALIAALLLMLGGTLLPTAFEGPDGHADHRLAMLVFWAMSAGFVRGVGFIPRHWLPRAMLSGWAASLGCLLAVAHVMIR